MMKKDKFTTSYQSNYLRTLKKRQSVAFQWIPPLLITGQSANVPPRATILFFYGGKIESYISKDVYITIEMSDSITFEFDESIGECDTFSLITIILGIVYQHQQDDMVLDIMKKHTPYIRSNYKDYLLVSQGARTYRFYRLSSADGGLEHIIFHVIRDNRTQLLQKIIDDGIKLDVKDQNGDSPAMAAAKQRRLDIFVILVENGLIPDEDINKARQMLSSGLSVMLKNAQKRKFPSEAASAKKRSRV